MENKTIRELFYEHDGNLVHKWDHYFEIYESYFAKYKGKKLNMLEIGVSHGGSLQIWKKYFGDQLQLFAIDINEQCKKFEEDNIKIFIGSQSDPKFLQEVLDQLPELDIILDDGGHTMLQQKISMEMLYFKLKDGGKYIVEDTHTSYWYEFHGGLKKKGTFIELAKDYIDSMYEHHVFSKNGLVLNDITRNIMSITFFDSIVVFDKGKRPEPFHLKMGQETITRFQPIETKKLSIFHKAYMKLFKITHPFVKNFRGDELR